MNVREENTILYAPGVCNNYFDTCRVQNVTKYNEFIIVLWITTETQWFTI